MTIVVTRTNAQIIRTSGTKLVKGGTETQTIRRDTTKLVKSVIQTRVIRAAYGIPGPTGPGVVTPIEVVSFEPVVAGQAIRIRATTGKGSPAQANAIATADVFGFATNSVGADATIEVTRDRLTVAD